MICFDLLELKQMYERSKMRDLFLALVEKGYTAEELEANGREKTHEIVDELIAKGMKSKEQIEMFVAIDMCFAYFKGADTKACFVLKSGIQPKEVRVKNIEELIDVVEERTLTDFAVWFGGLRQVQLKQYTGKMETDPFFEFVKKKLASYGNELGDVNLLVLLKGEPNTTTEMVVSTIDFEEVHNRVKALGLTFKAEILISYNEANKHTILNQIYPELKSMQKDLSLPSSTWE